MTADVYAGLLATGRQEVGLERARRGLGPVPGPVHVAGAPAAPGVGVAVAGDCWVLANCFGTHKIGEKVTPPPGHPVLGDWGLMNFTDSNGETRALVIKKVLEEEIPTFCEDRVQSLRTAEAIAGDDKYVSDDVRTLEVRYGANGERLRAFRDSVKELQQVEFSDFPMEPRTTLDYCRAIASVSESAVAQHHMWASSSRIPDGDRSLFEDETLARILDAAVTYDALNVANLCCMELVVRRRQLIADAHSQTPGMPSYLAADHYMGQTYRSGGGIVTPALTDFVAKQMAAQSSILKEKRKMEESKGKGKKAQPKATPKGGGGAQQ